MSKELDKLSSLGVVCIGKGFKCPFCRGMSFFDASCGDCESGVLLLTVIGEVLRSVDELLAGAVSTSSLENRRYCLRQSGLSLNCTPI